MAKHNEIRIRFEREGLVFFEAAYDALPEVLTIGRSRDCQCRIPEEDKNASGRHARLEKTKKGLFIFDDKSRNGVYLAGERIERRKVEPGDVYSFGESRMIVEEDFSSRRKSKERFHRLEQLSGEEKGRIWKLEKERTVVGSEPDADIQIPDLMVSRHHAAFEQKADESCWVKDLGSRNGTKVNGVRMTEDALETGRMLKDGDIVSVVYVDYRFLDRRAVHVRSHFLRNLAVVFLTLALGLGGYFSYRMLTPDAINIRLAAEQLASEGRFDDALATLAKAKDARGFEADASRRGETVQKIRMWKDTFETWSGIKAKLQAKGARLQEINASFAPLISAANENWKWNATSAPVEGRKARMAHELLSTLLTARDAFTSAEPSAERIANLLKACESAVKEGKAFGEAYLNAPLAELDDLAGEMKATLEENARLVETMNGFVSTDRADATLSALRAIAGTNAARSAVRREKKLSVSSLVANASKTFEEPVETLSRGYAALLENYRAVARFEFGSYREDIPLPTMEQCLCFASLGTRRDELNRENEAVGGLIRQLRNFIAQFGAAGIERGKTPADCGKLFDPERLEKVLACDCLEHPAPGYSDAKPTGLYDETLGVHVFFSYLNSLDGEFDTSVLDERFVPVLFAVPSTLSLLEAYLDFTYGRQDAKTAGTMERIRNSLPESGGNAILAWAKFAQKQLDARTRFTKNLYRRFLSDKASRAGIIAGGMACRLRGRGATFLPEDFNLQVYESFRALRKAIGTELLADVQRTPDQKAALERKVLQTGIPGDSYLKQPWADAFKAKEAQP